MFTLLQTLSGSNTTQQFSGDRQFARATFWGYKNFTNTTGVNNSGALSVGVSNSGYLHIALNPGVGYDYILPDRQTDSLSNFYFRGTSGDGVFVVAY